MSRRCWFFLAMFSFGCGEQTVELFDACVGCDAGATGTSTRDRDPERCGAEEEHCEDDEYCVVGACVCRPPLTRVGDDCVDLDADGSNCGGDEISCTLCVDGACGASCGPGQTECDAGCVDTDTHPLHCGECGRPCGANAICVAGSCVTFEPAACDACPCASCTRACCTYPGRPSDPICLDGDGC